MALSRELYQRFVQGACNEQEELEVLQHFREHPEAMEEYLQTEDWEAFQPSGRLHPAVTNNVLNRISQRIFHHRRRKYVIRTIAAAALLTGIAVLVWIQSGRMPQPLAQAPVKDKGDTITYRQYRNSTASTLRLTLEDGSVVRLQPGSNIRYRQQFDSSKRDIWLSGSARFDVAGDSRRPFTVYAGATATTALGTSFGVAADSIACKVTVKLYSGKVVVRQYGMPAGTFADRYLLPGDELVYNTRTGHPVVHNAVKRTTGRRLKSAGEKTGTSPLAFRRQPLGAVLAMLEQHYGIQITYNRKDVAGIRVTAEFSDTDTPEQILQTIALLNELSIERDATGGYILKK